MARRELFILLGLATLSGLTVHIWTTAALGIMLNLRFSMPASFAHSVLVLIYDHIIRMRS